MHLPTYLIVGTFSYMSSNLIEQQAGMLDLACSLC